MAEYVKTGGSAGVKERQHAVRPRRYKVLLLNDHYTTMEFVVLVLQTVFRKSSGEARRIMLSVHENGKGVAGVYTKGIAESKVDTTHRLARDHGFPLRCGIEPE